MANENVEPGVVTFVREVRRRLPEIESTEYEFVNAAIVDLFERGWTVHETRAWCYWLEHVNPDIGEDVALRNMKRISDLVKLRMDNGRI
jgi:hypothetical protein